jgi:hypothetical protein
VPTRRCALHSIVPPGRGVDVVKPDLDLQLLRDIPDPFADGARPPLPSFGVPARPVSPTRSRVRAMRAGALAAALAYDACWLAVFRIHGGGRPSGIVVLGVLIPLAAAAIALAAATRQGSRGLGETRGRIVALTVGAVGLFVSATAAAFPVEWSESFWLGTANCLVRSAIFAGGPLALAAWAFRHAFATGSALKVSALGVACGALAAVMMNLVCPDDSAYHVLVGHGAMMIVAGAVGAWLGRRVGQA